ncbi:MAG TPA: AAA family ATPase [Actinocrinis sp.]|uniref:AAA family ATPase n=1 Tax=Actinocrinis sp. TaxID=1920516 RepID=UPI002DDD68D2|nr:AAA family ATPase [Actinocrinis sp.]HEV2347400.1 AAA family ATPase [Actinocrinis sp.]
MEAIIDGWLDSERDRPDESADEYEPHDDGDPWGDFEPPDTNEDSMPSDEPHGPGGTAYTVHESDTAESAATDAFERAVSGLLGELLDSDGLDDIPALEPLIDGYLYRDTIARVIGPSGHMKSFVALDFAAHVGTGQQWRNRHTVHGDVIYLIAEGAGGFRKRVRAWEQYYGRKMTGVRFLPRPVQAADAVKWNVLIEVCRRLKPALIIFDTQARITVGVEENSAKEMGLIVDRVEQLRTATRACVVLVHHQGLNGDHGRGSTTVKGAAQTELRVTKRGKKAPDARVIVSSDKQKDDEELDDMAFGITVVKLSGEAKEDGSPVTSVVLVPADLPPGDDATASLKPSGRRVLAALQGALGPLTVKGIGDVLAAQDDGPLKPRTIQDALAGLAEQKLAEVAGTDGFAQTWRPVVATEVGKLSDAAQYSA